MNQTLITTRPERTSDQIAADRKSATAFFHKLATLSARDLGRIAAHEGYDYKLLMADQEGRQWAGRNNSTELQRKAKREATKALNPLLHRDNSKKLRLVDGDVKAMMPRRRLHTETRAARAEWKASNRNWKTKTANVSGRYRARVLKDARSHFEQWLLCNPNYGPLQAGEYLFPRKRFNPAQTRKGQISPAGMTPERALQIALRVIDDHGGHW